MKVTDSYWKLVIEGQEEKELVADCVMCSFDGANANFLKWNLMSETCKYISYLFFFPLRRVFFLFVLTLTGRIASLEFAVLMAISWKNYYVMLTRIKR